MSDTPPLPAPIGGNSNLPPPPPHPLDGEWFIYLEGKNYGPYTGHTLKTFLSEGRIDDKTSVCAVGKSEWITASNDAVLGTLFRRAAACLRVGLIARAQRPESLDGGKWCRGANPQ